MEIFNKLEDLYINLKSSNPIKQFSNCVKKLKQLKDLNPECKLEELKNTDLLTFMQTIKELFIKKDYEIKRDNANQISIAFIPGAPIRY